MCPRQCRSEVADMLNEHGDHGVRLMLSYLVQFIYI